METFYFAILKSFMFAGCKYPEKMCARAMRAEDRVIICSFHISMSWQPLYRSKSALLKNATLQEVTYISQKGHLD